MKIAIMQPYIFPYLGYFQLINAVDKFLVLDDVAYINKGWINRNRIIVNGRDQFFVLPVKGASQNKMINTLFLLPDEKWRKNLETTIEMAYRKAPGFDSFFPVVQSILAFESTRLSTFLFNSLRAVCEFLEITTTLVPTTAVYDNQGLKGADRVIDLCMRENAKAYINPPGGTSLYDKQFFESRGISLAFLQPRLNPYPQAGSTAFVAGLSIVDLLMNNPRAFVQEQLKECTFS